MSAPARPLKPDAVRLAHAADPAPSSIERGAVARVHWRHAVTTDDALADVVDPASPSHGTAAPLSGEWSSVMAETHARLVDPAGVRDLPRPSPVGVAVGRTLTTRPEWQRIADAAALHPSVARDAVVGLASVIRDALVQAGAQHHDTRRALSDLDAARAAVEAARKRRADLDADPTATDADRRKAAGDDVEARRAEERAKGEAQAADAAGARVAAALAPHADGTDPTGAALATVLGSVERAADDVRLLVEAGLGSALGAQDPASIPHDVVGAITPEVRRILPMVGALRLSLREGRAARHLPGREGMLGPDVGGLDRVGDLVATERAALAGLLGPDLGTLARLRLVRGKAAVIEKGGGRAKQGDVVLVLDKSGSMGEYGRNVWASALALAILLEARAQNRVVAVVTYDGRVRESVIVDGAATLREAFTAICRSAGGDNNEHAALVEAGRLLGRMRKAGQPADVVMLTDGQWQASNMAGVNLGANRMRLVLIGGTQPPGSKFASVHTVTDGETSGAGGHGAAVRIAETVV